MAEQEETYKQHYEKTLVTPLTLTPIDQMELYTGNNRGHHEVPG
jgi:hypothetical protein